MKRQRIFPVAFILLAFTAAAPLRTAAQTKQDPALELMENVVRAYESLESYKYVLQTEGMDTFTKDRQKQISGNFDSLAKKAGVEHEVEDKPKLVRGTYEVKFMKPYLSQMKVIKSGFTPKIVWGTLVTYRSDKDPNVWWAKPKISPVAIKRSVEKDDAGGALTSNWLAVILNMLYYSANSEASLGRDAPVDGRNCRVLRLTFDWNKKPAWDRKQPPFDRFAIPAQIRKILWDGMLDVERQKFSWIDYYIDSETFHVLKVEEFIEGRFHWRNSFREIELNTLKEKDF